MTASKHCQKCHDKKYFYLDPENKLGRMPCGECQQPTASPALLTQELELAMVKLRKSAADQQHHRLSEVEASALLQHIAALEQRVEELEPGAECWAALCAIGRMKLMGCTTDRTHIGLEFWVTHPAKGDAQDAQGRAEFCTFIKQALAAYRAQPTQEGK